MSLNHAMPRRVMRMDTGLLGLRGQNALYLAAEGYRREHGGASVLTALACRVREMITKLGSAQTLNVQKVHKIPSFEYPMQNNPL